MGADGAANRNFQRFKLNSHGLFRAFDGLVVVAMNYSITLYTIIFYIILYYIILLYF